MVRSMAHTTNGVGIRLVIIKVVLREIMFGADDAGGRLGGERQQGTCGDGKGEEGGGFHSSVSMLRALLVLVVVVLFCLLCSFTAGFQRRFWFSPHPFGAGFPTADAHSGKFVVWHPPLNCS